MFALTRTLSKKLTRGIDTMFYSRNVKKGVLLCFSRVAPPVNDYCDDDYDVGDSTDNTCLQGHICGGGGLRIPHSFSRPQFLMMIFFCRFTIFFLPEHQNLGIFMGPWMQCAILIAYSSTVCLSVCPRHCGIIVFKQL